MGVIGELITLVRGKVDPVLDLPGGGEGPLVTNPRGDLSIAQALPYRAEVVRMRNSYSVLSASAVAPVVAMPTTAAHFSMSNNEADGGRSYIIDGFYQIVVASAAAATPLSIAVMLNTGRSTAVAATLTAKGLAGQVYRGSGTFAVGTTVVDEGWFPVGNSGVGAAGHLGHVVETPVDGLFIVPPGGKLSLVSLANTVTTITCRIGVRWHEVQIPIG